MNLIYTFSFSKELIYTFTYSFSFSKGVDVHLVLVVVEVLMSLIHYSFAPLILCRVPYTLDLLPYYLSIANGAGGVGIFELLVFQCFV